MGQKVASLYAEIGADTSGIKKGLSDTKRQLQGAKGDFASMASQARAALTSIGAAVFAVGVGVKALNQLYKIGRAGAFLELTEKRFARLAGEAGATADVLQRELRTATRGTMSDMQLMAAATDILSLKLVATGDQAIRLTRIVGALGADMNQVTLALTNQTTARFDQIGIAVGGFEKKLKDLEAQGLSTQAAFTEAFLQQGEEQIRRTGDIADDAAGSFLRLEAALKNFADTAKKDAAEAVQPFVKALGDMLINVAFAKKAMDDGRISFDEYNEGIDIQNGLFVVSDELLAKIAERYAENDVWLVKLAEDNASWDHALRNSTGALDEQADAVFDLSAALSDLQLFVDGPLGSAFEQFGAEQDAMIEQYARLRDEIAFFEGSPQTAEGQQHLMELRTEMGNVEQAIVAGSEAFDEQTRRMLFDLVLQRIAIAELPPELQAAAFQMVNDMALAWGLIDEMTWQAVTDIDRALGLLATGNVDAAKQALFELGGWANSVAGDYYIRFHVITSQEDAWDAAGMPDEGRGGVGGAANSAFPPGTFTPPASFGAGAAAAAAKTKAAPTMRQIVSPFLDAANAFSSIGNIFAQKLQDELIEPLQKKIDAIDALLSPAHIDMVARERAAELEQERAKAAEDMALAQEKILMLQKAQMNLQFLEQQIKLLDLIAANGLDADAILGGLELGIDADAFKVVEAMARAINAMIAKAEEKLGIASPSKVTMEWGRYLVQGLAMGVKGNLGELEKVPQMMSDAVFTGGLPIGSGKNSNATDLVVNVYPSEGMNEEALARKVGEVLQRKIY